MTFLNKNSIIIAIIILLANILYVCGLIRKSLLSNINNKYETDGLLNEYINAQYGIFLIKHPYKKTEDFYQLLLQESKPYLYSVMASLDVGCALGRLVFEFEKHGIHGCYGIDSSHSFIQFCKKVQHNKVNMLFKVKANSNCVFMHGDILKTSFENQTFGFISCINVIDRVDNPQMLLDKLHALLTDNGILLLSTPYDWEFSPAPFKLHIDDMKKILPERSWTIEKELRDIPFTMSVDKNDRTYLCHVLIVKRK